MASRLRRLPVGLLVVLALILAGCSPAATPTTTDGEGPSSAVSSDPNAEPTPIVSADPVEPGTSGPPPDGQTDTEWGRIWDQLPAGFPQYPGATVSGDASAEVVSGRFAVIGGDPAEIASWLQQELEMAAYSTEALSGPLEDGSFVLDSVGEGECRIQTAVAPLGRITFVEVRYGAACPLG